MINILLNKIKFRLKANRVGFTLIEAVTTMGIFVIVMITIVNLYMIYSRAQRITGQRQKMLSEASFVVEKMAQEIRTREIRFPCPTCAYRYGDSQSYTNLYNQDFTTDGSSNPPIFGKEIELALDANAESSYQIYYYFYDGNSGSTVPYSRCGTSITKGLYKYSQGAIQECQKLFAFENIEVEDAGFYITPSFNPYPDQDQDCISNVFQGSYCSCSSNSDCDLGLCKGAAGNKICSFSCDNDADCRSSVAGTCGTVDKVCKNIQQQPRVTFYIKIRDLLNRDQSGASSNTITLQTTVSSRIYKK